MRQDLAYLHLSSVEVHPGFGGHKSWFKRNPVLFWCYRQLICRRLPCKNGEFTPSNSKSLPFSASQKQWGGLEVCGVSEEMAQPWQPCGVTAKHPGQPAGAAWTPWSQSHTHFGVGHKTFCWDNQPPQPPPRCGGAAPRSAGTGLCCPPVPVPLLLLPGKPC